MDVYTVEYQHNESMHHQKKKWKIIYVYYKGNMPWSLCGHNLAQ